MATPTASWVVLGELAVAFGEEAFWHALREWTMRPTFFAGERVLVQMRAAEQDEATGATVYDTLLLALSGPPAALNEEVPADVDLPQTVTLTPALNRVEYRPHPVAPASLPSYYPKCSAFAITLVLSDAASFVSECDAAGAVLRFELLGGDSSERRSLVRLSSSFATRLLARVASVADSFGASSSPALTATLQRLVGAYRSEWQRRLSDKRSALSSAATVDKDLAVGALLLTRLPHVRTNLTVADVGCGKGFLAQLLAMEGVGRVRGVDAVAHSTWTHCDAPALTLTAEALTVASLEQRVSTWASECASDAALWLVGNRCDALTPWLLYAASLPSAVHVCALLVPCCAWTLEGRFEGAYAHYLVYLERLAERLGLRTERVQLRELASEKNVVLVVSGRVEGAEAEAMRRTEQRRCRELSDTRGGSIGSAGKAYAHDGY